MLRSRASYVACYCCYGNGYYPRLDLEEKIRQYLSAADILKSSITVLEFLLPRSLVFTGKNDERRHLVRIKNPLGEDLSAMRTTMIYGLLETAKKMPITVSFDLSIFE